MNDKKKTSTLKVERPSKDKPSTLVVAETKATVAKTKAPKAGRKPIPKEERQNVSVNFKVTKAQYEAIEQQAGLVPISAFLKAKLKDAGVL